MTRSRIIRNWILRITAGLMFLTLLSVCKTSQLYARYSTGVAGGDSARVAKFEITNEGDLTQTLTIDNMFPGDTRSYQVQVTSNSEVAVYYTISVKNQTGNLPLEFAMQYTADGANKGTISPNETDKKTYSLTVTWPKGKNDPDYAGKADLLLVTLTATQVD